MCDLRTEEEKQEAKEELILYLEIIKALLMMLFVSLAFVLIMVIF